MEEFMHFLQGPSVERTTSSAATTMQRSEQPSYTHSSAAVRHMMLMFDRGWRIHLEESLQKRILASYYLATGRPSSRSIQSITVTTM